MLSDSHKHMVAKVFKRVEKVLYMFVSLLERILTFALSKTKSFLEKSFDEDKKSEDKIDTYLNVAKNALESDFLEKREMKFEIDNYVNSKLDEIVFFRSLIKDFSFPDNRVKDLTNMENEIYNQLLAYSELQKGNTKAEVALIGGFSSGKSTIINSFLKKEVCPSDQSPTTSSVTKFYFSDTEIISLDGKKISPQQYAGKVRHKNLGKDTKTYIFEYGYNADIFNSIVLYDTPGFGNAANKNDDIVTEKILKDVDVVIYTIVVDKGSLDQQDIEILKRLKKYKNKKIHCIINKSDLKSLQQIEKIKKQIEEFGIFDIVIAYSATNVLNASKHFSIENFLEVTKQKIYHKSIFESIVKGEEYSGRRNKKFYHLLLDGKEINSNGIDAIIQRDKLKKIFNNISMQKHDILHNSFLKNEKRYKLRAKSLLKDILSEIDTYSIKSVNSKYQYDIENIFRLLKEVEHARVRSINITIIKAYNASLSIEKRTKKGFIFDDHYYWIILDRGTLDTHLVNFSNNFLAIYEEIMDIAKNTFKEIQNNYDIEIIYPKLDNNYLLNRAIDIIKNLYNTAMVGHSREYTSEYEIDKLLKYYKLLSTNTLLNRSYLQMFSISNDIKSLNIKTLEQKSGMLQQDTQTTDKSRIAIKSKIKNYLKGEENA